MSISYPNTHGSDYNGTDADGDGIGDTPYQIDEDRDKYPLMFEPTLIDLDLTREEAIERLMAEVIQSSPNADMLVAYGLQHPLPASDLLQSLLPADITSSTALIGPPYTHGEAWFFWIDDLPLAAFAHPTRFILIDLATGAVEVKPEEWWPVVNGEPYWNTTEIREDNADIVYQGAQAYANPVAPNLSAQHVTNLYVLQAKKSEEHKFAILVRDSPEKRFSNSIEAMKKQLIEDGFSEKNIIVVESYFSAATKQTMLNAFVCMVTRINKYMKTPIAKDPEFLFYYVGHSNKLNGMVFGKKGQKAETMNYGIRGTLIKPDGTVVTDTLAGNLLSIPSKDITVIIDSCKSGTAIEAISNVGLKGQILTATNDDRLALGWRFCRMDYTSYLLDGRKKHGSFWLGHDHAVYKGKHYWWYKDPEPQKKKLEGKFHSNVIVEGKVTDKESGKAISRATIKIKGTRVQGTEEKTCTTTTDKDGKYRIKLPWWGTFNFKVEAEGYKLSEYKMELDGAALIDFELAPEEKSLTLTATPTPTHISKEVPGNDYAPNIVLLTVKC